MKKTPAPTPEDYLRAAEIVKERGWNRGGYTDTSTGAVCLLGAIYYARAERLGIKTPFDKEGEPRRTIDFAIPREVQDKEFGPWTMAWEWNDSTARGKGQVSAKLRRLAKVSA
jgi:hypothetical protein